MGTASEITSLRRQIRALKAELASAQDRLSEHKDVLGQLQQSRAQLHSLYQSFPVPTYTWRACEDGDLVLVDFNRSAAEARGEGIRELLGQRASVIHAEHPRIQEELRQCLRTKRSLTREME